jgi:hypothetical protein
MENRMSNDTLPLVSRFRANPDVVTQRIGDQVVLVHIGTNRIYELNRTGTRFWELLCAGHDQAEIRHIILQEFEVTEDQLAGEIEELVGALTKEDLISSYHGD